MPPALVSLARVRRTSLAPLLVELRTPAPPGRHVPCPETRFLTAAELRAGCPLGSFGDGRGCRGSPGSSNDGRKEALPASDRQSPFEPFSDRRATFPRWRRLNRGMT